MTDQAPSQDMRPEEAQPHLRTRTFLKAIVYYDNRRASIECTIRDLSDTGARCLPGTDIALRRVQASRRGADCGLLRRVWLPGLYLPLRLDPGRALHPWPCLRFLPQAAGRSLTD